MNKETMTLREALSTKKVLDKQIASLAKSDFLAIITADTKIISGMTVDDFKKNADEKWQSFNDKIKRRNALANAILNANVNNTVSVPKFVSLDKIGKEDIETEDISFASAIERKAYYSKALSAIVGYFQSYIKSAANDYEKTKSNVSEKIFMQLNSEFGQTTNASSKQRAERQAELESKFETLFLDPCKLVGKIDSTKMAIEDYLCKIDSVLGHATEVTEITIEY